MATSSITHNFVISGIENVERFIAAIEASEKDPTPKRELQGRELTDPDEILAFMARREQKNV